MHTHAPYTDAINKEKVSYRLTKRATSFNLKNIDSLTDEQLMDGYARIALGTAGGGLLGYLVAKTLNSKHPVTAGIASGLIGGGIGVKRTLDTAEKARKVDDAIDTLDAINRSFGGVPAERGEKAYAADFIKRFVK